LKFLLAQCNHGYLTLINNGQSLRRKQLYDLITASELANLILENFLFNSWFIGLRRKSRVARVTRINQNFTVVPSVLSQGQSVNTKNALSVMHPM